MSFGWPPVLFALLFVPVALAGYVLGLRRRRRRTVTYSSVALLRAAAPPRRTWRRHVPFAALLAACAFLMLAAARPQVRVEVPRAGSAVVLAVDVSGSMCATDVQPNRLAAAQQAVRDFVASQDPDTRIGLVVFSGFAQLAVPPTTDRDAVRDAVAGLTTGRGTTIGAAILTSVDAIAQVDADVPPTSADATGGGAEPGAGAAPGTGTTPAPRPGRYAPEIVVLLTDGANTAGISPVDAAQVAASRGVRVFPIGFGTTSPTTMSCTADQLGGQSLRRADRFGGGGPRTGNYLLVDESTLRDVARITGGTYFAAGGARELQDVLADLPRHVELQERDVEVAVGLVALGVLLVLGAAAAAVRWTGFP